MSKLTAKQQRFVEEYCNNGFNATQAAKAAGYKEHSAKQQGTENLAKPAIAAKIEEYKAELSQKALIDTEWVVNRLIREAEDQLGDGSSSSRTAALKILSEYTGGFDANKNKHEVVQVTHEQWLDNLK